VEPDLYGDEDDKRLSSMEIDPDALRRNVELKSAPSYAIVHRVRTADSHSARLARSIVRILLLLQQVNILDILLTYLTHSPDKSIT